jgi:hypothetical protein
VATLLSASRSFWRPVDFSGNDLEGAATLEPATRGCELLLAIQTLLLVLLNYSSTSEESLHSDL